MTDNEEKTKGNLRFEHRFELKGADLERLILVGSDLEFLKSLPSDRLLSHTEVRLAASVLRRLLIDGHLQRCWSLIGLPKDIYLNVEANDLDSLVEQWKPEWIRYAWAGGGGPEDAAAHDGFILSVVPKAVHESYGSLDAFHAANPLPRATEKKSYTIEDWLKSSSAAIGTNIGLLRVSRREVLKYLANRKGGVHFDARRDLDSTKPSKARLETIYSLLDHGLIRIGHLSGPEFEVYAMAKAIVQTQWSYQFIRIAHEVAPDDLKGDPKELKFWAYEKQPDGTGWATMRYAPTKSDQGNRKTS